MKDIIKRVPLPLSGAMLGVCALGNLLQSYSEAIRYLCGIVGAVLLVLLLLKLILYPSMIKEDLKNPIMASVSATFPMSLMLLSTYIKPFIGAGAIFIWYFAILLHIILIVYFTISFVVKLQMPKVFASYFVVYVGIAVAAITAPAYEQIGIGTIAFWFGLCSFVVLLVIVSYRYLKYKQIPEPAKPLVCIYAAPLSLCIAGYVQSVTPKSVAFLIGMFVVSSVLYLLSFVKMIGYLKLPFYPSYASFTFPFVISAIAAKQTMACAMNLGNPLPFLSYVVLLETIIATLLVIYVIFCFLQAIFASK